MLQQHQARVARTISPFPVVPIKSLSQRMLTDCFPQQLNED
jgi:hypothetical protein